MKALILAGGKGTRLQRMTQTLPKPMVRIAGKPVLEYQIELLKKYGICDITILVNYLSEKIKKYFKEGKRWGVKINYFEEKIPLGTAGGIGKIQKSLKNDFLVLYGDLMANIDLMRLIKFHKFNSAKYSQCIGTLVVQPKDYPSDCDLVKINSKNQITKFLVKPHSVNILDRNLANAAIYILSPKIHPYIPQGIASDFGKEIFPSVLERKKHSLYAYYSPEYMKDMGTVKRFGEVESDVKKGIF